MGDQSCLGGGRNKEAFHSRYLGEAGRPSGQERKPASSYHHSFIERTRGSPGDINTGP